MGSAGRGFRGRGGGMGGRGGGAGGRFGGRGMGRMDNHRPSEPVGPRDPRSLISYVDVDAPKVCSLRLGLYRTASCIWVGSYDIRVDGPTRSSRNPSKDSSTVGL